jgi:uroporphyrinogen-III decarboxylase
MKELPCGERVVRCLVGEPVDHVPYGVGLGWSPWGDTLDRWRREAQRPSLDLVRALGFEDSFLNPEIYSGIYPPYEYRVIEENVDFVIYREERGITKRDRRDKLSMPEFLDYPVKTEEDWERLKVERLDPATRGRIAQDWDAFRARLRITGQAVQVGSYPWGVFGMPRDLLGDEELLISFYTRPAMIKDMMQHLTKLWISTWEHVAAEVQIDHIHIWEDMSGKQGSLISPRMVEEFMMPCYDRIVDFARAHSVRLVSVDTDGDCSELVPIMVRHGVNYYLPFEVQAGNDILAYRQQYPTLGILGGLDKRALASTRADVDAEVARCADMLKHGRYIPGFDHLIPPDAKWDNFQYAAGEVRKLCFQAGG